MAKNEIDKAVQNLITMSGKKVEIKKVWENASPTSDFKAQNIDVSVADNELIMIEGMNNKNYNDAHVIVCAKNQRSNLRLPGGYTSYREVYVTGTQVQFGDGKYYSAYGQGAGLGSNAGYGIPTKIYLIKGVI